MKKILKKVLKAFFPTAQVLGDYTEEELKILEDVGFKTYTQADILEIQKVNLEIRKIEQKKKMEVELILTKRLFI